MSVGTRVQARRATAAQWASANPTLLNGEIGFEYDSGKLKIGNGSTAWNSLGYGPAGTTPTTHSHAESDVTNLVTDLAGKVPNGSVVANIVTLTGVTGEYITTPDTSDLRINGDLELIWGGYMTDWTPASNTCLMGKWTSTQNAYLLRVQTSGALAYFDQNVAAGGTFSANPGFVDGRLYYIKLTHNVTTGSVNFSYSEVGPRGPWTSITTNALSAGSRTSGTAQLSLGAYDTGGSQLPLSGGIRYAEVRSGINGATVAWFDASAIRTAARTPTTATEGGRVWTMNGSAWDWARTAA